MDVLSNDGARISRPIALAGNLTGRFLRFLPPEFAHNVGLGILRSNYWHGIAPALSPDKLSALRCTLPGVGSLIHPLGLAAGFDKSATCFRQLAHLGFSFLEVGTVTPQPQEGNPKPRIFRLPEQRSLINRMGFNNDGVALVSKRLQEDGGVGSLAIPVGVNIGINRNTPLSSALSDYLTLLRELQQQAGYFVVNISSPNTPSLRSLANPTFIRELASSIAGELSPALLAKVWIKLDPDLSKHEFQEIIAAIAAQGFAGIILSNTHKVTKPWAGGQSGHPLAIASTTCLSWAWEVHRGALPMVGCGGILSGEDVLQKIMRGACCVQIYTAMIYRGPWVVWELLHELEEAMALRGFTNLEEARGTAYQ